MIKMETNMGVIVLELNTEKAPKSVMNFVRYVNDKFYDGTTFHRIIDGFMVQGGGYTVDYEKKDVRPPITNEANNGLKNVRGSVALARTNLPHSADSQFFINVVDNHRLDHRNQSRSGWGYAVIGKVAEGMDVVDKIKSVETGRGGPFRSDVPAEPIIIEKATVIDKAKP
ncbi:MAG: peptidylprolyl isomerase [Pseudomonadota bacterium]